MSQALAFPAPPREQTTLATGDRPRCRPAIVGGLIAIAVFLGGFTAWAVLTSLSSAAVAPGRVAVEGSRKTVQHLEGGIIAEILVREGEHVGVGQPLLRLDDTRSGASREMLETRRDALLAREARLAAERDGKETMTLPAELAERVAHVRVGAAIASEQAIFESHAAELAGRRGILRARIAQLGTEIDSFRAQQVSQDRQLAIVEDELRGKRQLFEKGLIVKPLLAQKEREAEELKGNREDLKARIAQREQRIGETRLQISQLDKEQQDSVMRELREVRHELVQTDEQLRVARDVESRRTIVAPISGVVEGLRYVTPGGVVSPGNPVLDIVPSDERLVVEAQINPADIDVVRTELAAEVRLTPFKQRYARTLTGRVVYVSADSVRDQATGIAYYKARIAIDEAALDAEGGVFLQAGMPAEVMILTGSHSVAEYLAEPVLDSFTRAFRER